MHTIAVAGPMFQRPISVSVGETLERDGFAYADIVRWIDGSLSCCGSFLPCFHRTEARSYLTCRLLRTAKKQFVVRVRKGQDKEVRKVKRQGSYLRSRCLIPAECARCEKPVMPKALLLAVLIVIAVCRPSHADLYHYPDEKGDIHITNDPGAVPEAQRKRGSVDTKQGDQGRPGRSAESLKGAAGPESMPSSNAEGA